MRRLIVLFIASFLACVAINYEGLDSTYDIAESINRFGGHGQVLFGSFVSKSAGRYSTSIITKNREYFTSTNTSFRLYSEDTGHDFMPEDRRWNKIAIIAEEIQKILFLGDSSVSYLAVFDADLIFKSSPSKSDFIAQLVSANSQAQVIMSEDSLDFGNSGFLIVKVSQWSYEFFRRWWAMRFHPNTNCDQHVLNALSLQLEQENQMFNLAIVKFGVINSKWPALENYKPTDNVLHLLGEYTEVRKAIGDYVLGSKSISRESLLKVKLDTLKSMFTAGSKVKNLAQCFEVLEHTCSMVERHVEESVVPCREFLSSFDKLQQDVESMRGVTWTSREWRQKFKLASVRFLFDSNAMKIASDVDSEKVVDTVGRRVTELVGIIRGMSGNNTQHVLWERQQMVTVYHLASVKLFEMCARTGYRISAFAVARELSKQSVSNSAALLDMVNAQAQSDNAETLIVYSVVAVKHLEVLHHAVNVHLARQQVDYNERDDALLEAIAICDQLSRLVEDLQSRYVGEQRLLVVPVRAAFKTCSSSVYAKRSERREMGRRLAKFAEAIKYYGYATGNSE